MLNLLSQNLPTGAITSATMPLREWGAQLGLANVDTLTELHLFQSLANSLVPKIRQKMGNMGQLSDRDLQFLVSQVPQLGNTPGANRLLVEIVKRAAQRQIEMGRMVDRYLRDNNGSLRGWHEHRRQYVEANPLYADLMAPF
jgi:hypothetical protein